MIDHGANPHIRNADGETHYHNDKLDCFGLKNVPSVKSVFYPIKIFPTGDLGDSWCYTTGVYDGKYGLVIGKGGEGTVIQGEWNGQPAAYKFVHIKGVSRNSSFNDNLADMETRLKEMTDMMATPGDAILPFQAHFR